MKNVTYLLGAGASAQAIPVVNRLNEEIELFISLIQSKYFDYSEHSLKIIREIWVPLFEKATKHSSVDTFAKKLYIKKDPSLWDFKCLLSAYFIYEQNLRTLIIDEYGAQISNGSLYSTPLDPRYDFFMAALLHTQDNQVMLPEHLSIVSWNYDSQIELAYSAFVDVNITNARKNLKMHPNSTDLLTLEEEDSFEDARIVKLNGTAGFYQEKLKSGYRISTYDNEKNLDYKKLLESIINSTTNRDAKGYEGIDYWDPSLNFAWELNDFPISKISLNTAKKIIEQTSTLVIIGYSFPVFNRDIDKLLFSENHFEKIYIQAHANDIKGIASRASQIMEEEIDSFILESNLDQFLIPFEI
jgi:hypothetical protein